MKGVGQGLPEFYMSWARSDPLYQNYFPDCQLLISPQSVRHSWGAASFKRQPAKLIIDSGAYWYIKNNRNPPPPKEIFYRQVKMAEGSNCPTTICHFDMPLSPKETQIDNNYRRIESTIGNAYEFMELFTRVNFPSNVESLGVIQGYDTTSVKFCAQELCRMGFSRFGLGSLASLYRPEEIISRVKAAMEVVGTNLHIFGISNIKLMLRLARLGINSFDSSRPMKAAIYNTVFYSSPFRIFIVERAKNKIKHAPVLQDLLPCSCPVCKDNPSALMVTGRKKYHNIRAIHNYYHLLREIQEF